MAIDRKAYCHTTNIWLCCGNKVGGITFGINLLWIWNVGSCSSIYSHTGLVAWLASGWQTNMLISGPVYMNASIATPELAANHHPGKWLDHLHIVEHPDAHVIFPSSCLSEYSLWHVIQHLNHTQVWYTTELWQGWLYKKVIFWSWKLPLSSSIIMFPISVVFSI